MDPRESLVFDADFPDKRPVSTKILHSPSILELGPDFYDPVTPARFVDPQLRYRNTSAAEQIGLQDLSAPEWMLRMSEFTPFPGNLPEPLALRYHGHQFTHYNPDLGDGRGFLYAQFLNPENGKLYDLGTKGSGQTPYSRDGDGRLTLKGAVREILATELLESLGVNTSKTFSVTETGESLIRYDEPSPTRAAVLVRMSHGHIRIGTFQRLAHIAQAINIKKLTAYSLRHYYPEITPRDESDGAKLFLGGVVRRCALLTAQWMFAGFVHGVLNSDNINISGESFDYGPYRFLPTYDVTFTAAYFDRSGLYSFGRQPVAMLWNLEQLALSLRFAFPELPAEEILRDFGDEFNLQVRRLMLQRLNLQSRGPDADAELLVAYFKFLESSGVSYEQSFFDFFGGCQESRLQASPQSEGYHGEDFDRLTVALKKFTAADPALLAHSYFQGGKPCTLLIDELEEIWKPIHESDDWTRFETKLVEIRSFRGIYAG
jgi:uncharacterized protein YdiU (UPF0061 family)